MCAHKRFVLFCFNVEVFQNICTGERYISTLSSLTTGGLRLNGLQVYVATATIVISSV